MLTSELGTPFSSQGSVIASFGTFLMAVTKCLKGVSYLWAGRGEQDLICKGDHIGVFQWAGY